ncbi:hypothetical protein [Clostridium oryzae]|uniref:hypothetical protein n=1 Tax=Clostridium oryzae TaxID=1450648 RepID=UPI001475B40F|nr:hypothetical protein [Clostridium oryzae]
MLDVCSTFLDDLFKWIAVNEVKLAPNKIGLVSVYDKDYFITKRVQVMIPVVLAQ